MFRPGQGLELHYPTNADVDIEGRVYVPRVIQIRKCRDLVKDPLTPIEFLRRPLLSRGRLLLETADLFGQRRFYPANSLEFATKSPLRVGWFHPSRTLPVTILSRSFDNTSGERELLRQLLVDLANESFRDFRIGIFADGLKIAS